MVNQGLRSFVPCQDADFDLYNLASWLKDGLVMMTLYFCELATRWLITDGIVQLYSILDTPRQ